MDKAEKNITNGRINELDFMKGILITLMVAFHLVYFGDYYPYAKQIVYTFHMPAFLVISGYLMKTERPVGKFLRTMWWIFVPYVLMECAYVVVASIVPIREHIDNLTAKVMLEKVFLHPIGPYWYLHTMMICGFTTFIVGRIFKRNIVSRLIVASLFIYLLSLSTDILSVANGLYFIGGAAIRYLKKDFRQIGSSGSCGSLHSTRFLKQNNDKGCVHSVSQHEHDARSLSLNDGENKNSHSVCRQKHAANSAVLANLHLAMQTNNPPACVRQLTVAIPRCRLCNNHLRQHSHRFATRQDATVAIVVWQRPYNNMKSIIGKT